jgi:hypothetical protein
VHPREPRKDLIAVEAQKPPRLEVRNAFDNLRRMWPRRCATTRAFAPATGSTLGAVTTALINPRRAHVQKFRNLVDRQNL